MAKAKRKNRGPHCRRQGERGGSVPRSTLTKVAELHKARWDDARKEIERLGLELDDADHENQALRFALKGAIALIDRFEHTKDDGWTAADVKRIEEIRLLILLDSSPRDPRQSS